MLVGTDNDYSVTQNSSSRQLDVYFKAVGAGSASRIQCDIGTFTICIAVSAEGATGAALAPGFDFAGYPLIPGVLHAYKASPDDLGRLVRPRAKH